MRWRPKQPYMLSAILMTFAIFTVSFAGDAEAAASTAGFSSLELRKTHRNNKSPGRGESSVTLRMEEEGVNVYIDCPIRNKTLGHTCEWFKTSFHGGNTKRITQFVDRYQEIDSCQFEIRSVTYEDAGTILCKVTNGVSSSPVNFTIQLTVTGPDEPFGNNVPKPSTEGQKTLSQQPYAEPDIVLGLLPEDRIYKADTGENILLKCEAHGNPKPLVLWRKGSENCTKPSEGYSNLKLTNLTRADAGAYKCEAVNIFGKVSTEIMLQVKGALQGSSEILEMTPKNITLYEGGHAKLTCRAKFEGDPWFAWVKKIDNRTAEMTTVTYEGQHYSVLPKTEIRPLGQHIFETTLVLQNVSLAYSGLYHCIVAGLQGLNHSEALIMVEKDPSKLHTAQIRRHKVVAILWIFSFVIFAALVILCIVRVYGCPRASSKKPSSQASLDATTTTTKAELHKGSPRTVSTDCTNLKHEIYAPYISEGRCSLTSQEISALLMKQECGSSCRSYSRYDPEYSGTECSDPENISMLADLEAARSSYSSPSSSCESEYCSQMSFTSPYQCSVDHTRRLNTVRWSSGRSVPHRHYNIPPPTPPPSPPIQQIQQTCLPHQHIMFHHQNATCHGCSFSHSYVPPSSVCSCVVDNYTDQNSQINLVYVV